ASFGAKETLRRANGSKSIYPASHSSTRASTRSSRTSIGRTTPIRSPPSSSYRKRRRPGERQSFFKKALTGAAPELRSPRPPVTTLALQPSPECGDHHYGG